MRLVLASSNQKKLAELQALLAPAGVTLVTQQSLGIAEAEEPHATFIENASGVATGNWRVVGDDLLWWSERDGWGHFYRYGLDGKLKNQVTRGPWVADRI